MVLADLGADVIQVHKPGSVQTIPGDFLGRNRRSVAIDTRTPEGAELVLGLVERSDVLIEGFRPGVTERLGIGPAQCLARNPRLVYGRMTGWGQDGPLADRAYHDINYIAVAGALEPLGRAGGLRRSRSTSWATSAGEGCCWRWACSPHCTNGSAPDAARSWTPRWSTGRRC